MASEKAQRLSGGERVEDRNIEMARRVAAAVDAAGGRTYYVGGCVRDRVLGHALKDIDIEVHGIPVQKLEAILDSLGERLTMGASFGIMGLRHYALDIAMPRIETATGRGHRDFAVCVDPFLGEARAARRRDFTMNALMENVLTGELLDFFGGLADIRCGVIRHVDDASYLEDPLRALRAAQFAARFRFSIAEETRALSAKAALSALPGERVMGELEKALLQAERPSIFFEELRGMRLLSLWFPELEALIGVLQNPVFHPEGDVWNHTMRVLDAAAGLRDESARPLWFMLAALCHDLGKAVTTEARDGVLHAYGHETAGVPLARRFLERLTRETKCIQYVLNMVELHMEPNKLAHHALRAKSFLRLFDRALCPEDLLLLARADVLGCGREESEQDREAQRRLSEMLALYHARVSAPGLTGRDLLDAGAQPGPLLGEALAYARKLRLSGASLDEQRRQTLAWLRSRR